MKLLAGYKHVLHVGCGPNRPEKLHRTFQTGEWQEIRVDIDPNVKPDLVASIISMPAVPSASMDAVWSSHNLEHLFAHEVPLALKEFFRVLKPGGFVLATMPDLQKVAEYAAADQLEETLYVSPAGPIAPIDVLFGHRASISRGNHFMAHRTGFTARSLAQKFAEAGFANIRVERKQFDLWGVAQKPGR